MAQHLVNVRVRPSRVVVLINRDAPVEDLTLALELFSRLWGGRFSQLLAVDPAECDPLTAFRLSQCRPEFVYGIDLVDEVWAKAVSESCQPRGYGRLQPEFVRGIRESHPEGHILVESALIRLIERRRTSIGRSQALRIVSIDKASPWASYCAAVFGVHYPGLRKDLYDEPTTFTGTSVLDWIGLVTEFVKNRQQSWLDVTGFELTSRVFNGLTPPTVVLVESEVADLSFFWNLRAGNEIGHPPWVIPIPLQGANSKEVLEKLKEWILALAAYGFGPNYCVVTSESASEDKCVDFTEHFERVLGRSPIKMVNFEYPRNRLPIIVPVEYEASWPVSITGRRLTFQPPTPKAVELTSSCVWMVDLVKDVKTRRAVEELQLPPRPATLMLLNGPCPPNFEYSRVPRTGDGLDGINVRCSESKEVINIYLPTPREIVGEILSECGLEMVFDEKRSSYSPVLKRFGGLDEAAMAFSGQFGSLFTAMKAGPKTLDDLSAIAGSAPVSFLGKATWAELMKCFYRIYPSH